ncbi:uncharacterized protein LOC118423039 [Branchiostoma floridae]|uniref:Uncharacterized protein LOC118423039 n=1 Tax=Branchiostoma floridae TaxID=7739 RepID=A0A9J7N0H8_BRAFL|nr:uncharacterized protein LOC118423039 [Branchiostoma floridae]
MLAVCEKLREVDAKSRRLGLVCTETGYLRALLDAMANKDTMVEAEALKSLGDVNVEKGRLDKNALRFDRATSLYRAALLRCEDAEVRESLAHRCRYAVKLLLGRVTKKPLGHQVTYKLHTNDRELSSPAKVAEKFLHLDRRLTRDCDNTSVLIEYTKLMIEGIVNKDIMLEIEAIKSLGDVYLRKGTQSRDTTCLTKATALYNTALARCEGVQGTVALIHRLLYTARIRQDMQRTGNEGSRFRQRQQYRRHLSLDLPFTSPNTEGQKFMLPSDYISSQTPKPVPDYRSYQEDMTIGDRALTDGKLDLAERKFAAALKLIHDPTKPDRRKEVDCLCRLGDVYVRRGKRTKEGRHFTQAAALYNAAMARTDEKTHSLTQKLQEIEQSLLQYTADVDSKSNPTDQAMRHKKRLEDIRYRAKLQLEAIDQQYDPYQYEEDDPCMRTVEAQRAEAVKVLFKTIAKDRQIFIRELVDECLETLGPPPCQYAFIGLGSQATELVTPYSDLEFAILIEEGKDNDDTRRYFISLTHYLHLKVISLGETILPAMAIPSLNDYQSEDSEKNWFFDSITPRGFAFDGFMPWACKTPFGRDKTKMKPQVSLIQTPTNMAKFQHLDISVSEGYHLSDILRRYVFLAGEEALVNEYEKKISEIITDGLLSHFKSRLTAMQILYENRDQFSNREPTGELLNVKKDIYRFPGIAIELLALCCQITLASAWDVIDRLKEMGKIEEENAAHLTVLTSISAELRLRTYMANGGQKDNLSPLTEIKYESEPHEMPDSILRSVFYIPDAKALFRYYCRAIPLKKSIPNTVHDSLEVQSRRLFKTTMFDASNECLGQIANKLLLQYTSKRHWEAALAEVGNNAIKRSKICNKLGQYWVFGSDISKAKHYFEQSLRICRGFYGDNVAHPDIVDSLMNMGVYWTQLGDQRQAISYFEQSLAMSKSIYGDSMVHLDIAVAYENLGICWSQLGDQKNAISYLEQSLRMRRNIYGNNTAQLGIAMSLNHLGGEFAYIP